MVSLPLIQRFADATRCWRQRRSVVVVAVLSSSCLLVLAGWTFADRRLDSGAGDQPSLLDLLDSVGKRSRDGLKGSPSAPATRAPRSRSWTSPLAHQCEGINPTVLQRLEGLQSRSSSWRRSVEIHPTNFGERVLRDANGRSLDASPRLVVLHETVYGMTSAINTFQTPHPRDEDQVSYHTLIGLDGQVVDLVNPLKRAYGAGFSAFLGEWAVTNGALKGSVNNFALHLSLETPFDGENMQSRHSGYTVRQYDSLALVLSGWLNSFDLPAASITTHRHVDLGGERSDPRSFDWSELQLRLAALGDLCLS